MEILKGTLFAAGCGYIISLVLAFLLALAFNSTRPDSDFVSAFVFLVRGTLVMSFLISIVLAPVSAVLGLVYSIIRGAVREGVEQGRASSSDS